jgi:hypothetical protein
MNAYVGYNGTQNSGFDSTDIWLELSGPMFDMPAGTAFFAAGFEKRSGGYYDTPDSLITSGSSSTNFRESTRGKTKVDEFFLERA